MMTTYRTVITLSRVAEKTAMLDLACSKCDRKGRYRLSKLIEEHGADMGLPQLRQTIAASCPRIEARKYDDLCGVHFPQLPRLF